MYIFRIFHHNQPHWISKTCPEPLNAPFYLQQNKKGRRPRVKNVTQSRLLFTIHFVFHFLGAVFFFACFRKRTPSGILCELVSVSSQFVRVSECQSVRVSLCYDGQPESFDGKVLRNDGEIGISISNRAFCAASRMGNSGQAIPKGCLRVSRGNPWFFSGSKQICS